MENHMKTSEENKKQGRKVGEGDYNTFSLPQICLKIICNNFIPFIFYNV
jgi:hypothetical protein